MAKPKKGKGNSKRTEQQAKRQEQSAAQKSKDIKKGGRSRSPLLKFVGFFLLFMLGFYLIYAQEWFQEGPLGFIMNIDAKISSFLLNIFGMGTTAIGDTVSSSKFSVDIESGCDGIEAIAIFTGAVIAYPKPARFKYKGILAGVGFLLLMNIVRIVTLFVTGVHFPKLFDMMHVEVWQVIFIVLAIVSWLVWIQSVIRREQEHAI